MSDRLVTLLNKFLGEAPGGRIRVKEMVSVNSHWCVALADDLTGKYAILDPRGRFQGVSGVLAGRWNIHAYDALEALSYFGEITADEHDRLVDRLRAREDVVIKKMEVEKLKARAGELGYNLIKRRAGKPSRKG